MAQEKNWEKEYKDSLFVTKKAEPQSDALRFFKFAKKYFEKEFVGMKVLDLGSGTGRNSNYLAALGADVFGMEISSTAMEISRKRAEELELQTKYFHQSIGEKFPMESEMFDVVLDVTSSNALNEKEREVYLTEVARVLKPGGLFFVRALSKDGDKNAKKLLKMFPGKEDQTYVMPKSGLIERVFSEDDFRKLYAKNFKILSLSKKSGYTKFDGQPYKRNYFLVYLTKI
jgi:ubiquinone/menaquinone biosynthesis C-methylase UbiE